MFDDAYRGLRDHAFPVLADAGFAAICAVVTDYAGRLNRWDLAVGGRRFAHLAWRDVERWATRGVGFVSHTATHPRLTWLPAWQAREECRRSRDAIGAVLGAPPRALCYPFGAAGERERRIARETGYTIAFTTTSEWRGDMMAVPRIPVYPWSSRMPSSGLVARMMGRLSIAVSAWQKLA